MITLKGTDPRMIANNLTPYSPTHPGEILKEEIEYRGLSKRKLAEQMGIAYSELKDILNSRRPMTEKNARLFEAALDVDAEPLMKMQLKYDMHPSRKNETFLARLRRVAAL